MAAGRFHSYTDIQRPRRVCVCSKKKRVDFSLNFSLPQRTRHDQRARTACGLNLDPRPHQAPPSARHHSSSHTAVAIRRGESTPLQQQITSGGALSLSLSLPPRHRPPFPCCANNNLLFRPSTARHFNVQPTHPGARGTNAPSSSRDQKSQSPSSFQGTQPSFLSPTTPLHHFHSRPLPAPPTPHHSRHPLAPHPRADRPTPS